MASCEERGWYCIRVGGMTSLGVLERVLERVLEHRSTSDEHSVVAALFVVLCGRSDEEQARSKQRKQRHTATCYKFAMGSGRPRRGVEEEGQMGGGLSRSSSRSPCGGG